MGVIEELELYEKEDGGKLVALEGDVDTISTQLRLLPPSQKILVLPSFIDSLPPQSIRQPFDARACIRDVFLAFAERTDTAQSFIRNSSPNQPRIVFMNGGSVCARTTCILRISENVTNGDVREAEDIFNEIVQYGVASLLTEDENEEDDIVQLTGMEDNHQREPDFGVETGSARSLGAGEPENLSVETNGEGNDLEMEAAALQRKIESFQEVSHTPKRHSSDVAIVERTGEVPELQLNSVEHNVYDRQDNLTFTTANGSKFRPSQVDATSKSVPSSGDRRSILEPRAHQGRRHSLTEARKSFFFDESAEDGEFDDDDGLFSLFPSPGVIFGEAELVDMHTCNNEKEIRRIKSADSIYVNMPSWQQITQSIPALLRHTTSAFMLGRPVSSVGFGTESFQTLPKRTFTRASKTIIKRSPPPTRSHSSVFQRQAEPASPIYVDRSTDTAEDILDGEQYDDDGFEEYVPIFPLVEDLVIQFTDSVRNTVVDSVVQSYKDGSYPLLLPDSETISTRSSSLPPLGDPEASRDTVRINDLGRQSPVSGISGIEEDDPEYESRHSYDPYNSNNRPPTGMDMALAPAMKLARADSGVQMPDPSSPEFSITTPTNEPVDKFVEFSTAGSAGTIFLQDALRELFSQHLPAGDAGYRQYDFSVTPEADRLWKPVFRMDEKSSANNESRTVDQIICLGSETGVQKEFFGQISGHIERLGMKKDGVSRSAKLDITYLIANMMQSYCSLPLTVQSTFNPLCNPTVLATLLIPQIEAYLASNTSTRLLILHYPISHLATVYALRQLIGPDTLKVAGILNTLASDPPSSVTRPRTPISRYNSNPLLGEPTSPLRQRASYTSSLRTSGRKESFIVGSPTPGALRRYASEQKLSVTAISFSKANYLLPSTATDSEITTFLSCIWKCLINKSSFYAPEPNPEPMIVERLLSNASQPPIHKSKDTSSWTSTPTRPQSDTDHTPQQRDSHYPLSSYRAPTVSSTTSARDTKNHRLTGSTKAGTYASSIASVKTTKSEKKRRADGSWENFYIGDEDSDDDDYDKMIMGRQHAKIVPEVRKTGVFLVQRNKQKALKWLGLA